MNERLLPKGNHYGLRITIANPLTTPGDFVRGGWKLVWHTTESPSGHGVDAIANVLYTKGAEVHCVIDPETGRVHQMVPFDNFARGLMHPNGTPETNRANCIQVEICGYASKSDEWPKSYYEHLAALAVLIEHRKPIPRKAPRRFSTKPNRYSPTGFVGVKGHVGHQHVPHNDHWDPGALRAPYLLRLMGEYDNTPQK